MSRAASPDDPGGVAARAGEALEAAVAACSRLPSGPLNAVFRLALADGRRALVKTSADAPAGGYAAEAAGLRWLAAAPGGPAVPEVLAVREDLLVLAWIEPAPRGLPPAEEEALGRRLAALHRAGGEAHGAAAPGTPPSAGAPAGAAPPVRIGPLELPGDHEATWAAVYARHRLLPLARLARNRGALDPAGTAAVEAVAGRMDELAGPPEPPARLHGDLWGGNVLAAADGPGVLIDPAAHAGHREVDLAMLRLFGGPGPRLHDAYAEAFPLADGHRERVELWQLVPLLVHAALFGGGYGPRAALAASRYT